MDYLKEHKDGFIGTIIFHGIVLLLLIFSGLSMPFHLDEDEEGITVNFGTSENGLGDIEPGSAITIPESAPTSQPEKVPLAKPQQKVFAEKEVTVTQDYEKTAAIKATEIEKRRKSEELAIEQAKETERLRKTEADRKAREEQQQKINEINSRAQGAFSGTGTGASGKGQGDAKSQGVTFPGGNQGVPTGDPNSNNYGQGGSGNGSKGSGVSFSLSGRTSSSLPKPKYPGDDEGLVVVKVTVDKFGNVTAAEPGTRGTTIMNQKFWEEAKQAALKAKFNVDNNAPAYQQGTISYRFVLD